LLNRKRVRVKETFSKWVPVWSGIPQGSLLGPILFIIYINDIVEQCDNGSEIYLYADDAKLFFYVKCEEDSFRLQKDIYSVIQWMEMWLLRLNTTKCKAMMHDLWQETWDM